MPRSCRAGGVARWGRGARTPETCQLAQVLLSEVIGLPVRERCERTDDPRWCFELPLPPQRDRRGGGVQP